MLEVVKMINESLYDNNNAFRLKFDLASMLRDESIIVSETAVILLAYLLFKANQFSNPRNVSFDEIKNCSNERIISMIDEYLNKAAWDKAVANIYSCNVKDLLVIIFSQDDSKQFNDDSTPHSLCKLSTKLLDIKDNDKVLDICCGKGNFIVNSFVNESSLSYFGCDTNTELVAIAYIRSLVLNGNINILQNNCFNLCNENDKFDKIFGNYPFGLKRKWYTYYENYIKQKLLESKAFDRASSDWIFNSLMIDLLNEDGKAIAIMPDSGLYNLPDKDIRQYFIENSYIEAIISLPQNIFPYSGIKSNLVVMNKKKKNGIWFIDASSEYEKGRRINTLNDENILNVINLLNTETSNSKFVKYDEIVEKDYSLNGKIYFDVNIEFDNGTEFGDVIKNITRGAPLNAKELDKLNSNEPTEFQYLMLANIQDGIIDQNLPYITDIEAKYQKYCIQNHNLLLSKFGSPGSPFKVAVAEIEDDKKILANGNLYIIEIDQTKANPYYLKALFESEVGSTLLSSISVGAHMPSISVGDLKKLSIPLPSLEEQNKIADEYMLLEDEIKVLTLKIERIKEKKKNVFAL